MSAWTPLCILTDEGELIEADSNFTPMDATRSRKVESDRRDALVRTRTRFIALIRVAGRSRLAPQLRSRPGRAWFPRGRRPGSRAPPAL